jgi:hypothetical protein
LVPNCLKNATKVMIKWFNDIPLQHWDLYGRRFTQRVDQAMKLRGDFVSDAGLVCTLKAKAKEMLSV